MSLPESTAEQVLAEVNATQEAPETPETPEAPDVPEPPAPRRLSWEDALKRVPPDVAELMREMRGDYTRKTQDLAKMRGEIMRERQAMLSGRKPAPTEVPEYDPFNEASIVARIEAEVARRMEAVLQPMQAEYEQLAAEEAYSSFLSEHEDLKTDTALRSEVQRMLEANEHLDLETAYWAAKGMQAKVKAAEDARAKAAAREANKAAATATAPARRVAPTSAAPSRDAVRRMSNADILARAQAMAANRK